MWARGQQALLVVRAVTAARLATAEMAVRVALVAPREGAAAPEVRVAPEVE